MKTLTVSMLLLGLFLSMQPQEIQFKKTTNYLCPDTHAVYALKHKQKVGLISWMGNGILELKVDQAYRNQGIGGRLFCYALSEIEKNKYDHAYWYAVDSIDFYRRFGAEVVDPQDAAADNASMHFYFNQHGNPAINYARYTAQKNNLSRNIYGI